MALHDNWPVVRQSFNELWLSLNLVLLCILNNFPRCSVSVNTFLYMSSAPFVTRLLSLERKQSDWSNEAVCLKKREGEVELACVLICIYLVNSDSQIVDYNKGRWKTKEQVIKTCRDHFLAEDDKNNTMKHHRRMRSLFLKMIIPEPRSSLVMLIHWQHFIQNREPFSIGGAARRLVSQP